MSWAMQLVIALAIFAGGLATGIKWHAGQDAIAENKARIEADRDRLRRLDRHDAAATGHEADKAALRTEFLTITQEVERVTERPVYRDMCFDADGVRLVNAAAGAAPAASQPARAVPGSAGPDRGRWQDRADVGHGRGAAVPGVPEPPPAPGASGG